MTKQTKKVPCECCEKLTVVDADGFCKSCATIARKVISK
jgi:hypothetical protein